GGAGFTRNHGQSFTQITLPIGQMYHVAIDNQVPYWIYSNRQDDGTMRGPSNSPVPVPNVPAYRPPGAVFGRGGRGGGGDANAPACAGGTDTWEQGIGGCESGFTLPSLSNPDIIWASCYGNTVTRYDAKQGRARSVSPWMHTLDSDPVGL